MQPVSSRPPSSGNGTAAATANANANGRPALPMAVSARVSASQARLAQQSQPHPQPQSAQPHHPQPHAHQQHAQQHTRPFPPPPALASQTVPASAMPVQTEHASKGSAPLPQRQPPSASIAAPLPPAQGQTQMQSARSSPPPPAVAAVAGVAARPAAQSPPPATAAAAAAASSTSSRTVTADELERSWSELMQALAYAEALNDDDNASQPPSSSGDASMLRSKQLLVRVVRAISAAPIDDNFQRVLLFVRTLAETELDNGSDTTPLSLIESSAAALFPFIHTFLQLLARPECAEAIRWWFAREVACNIETFLQLLHVKQDEQRAVRAARLDVQQLVAQLLPHHHTFVQSLQGGAAAFHRHASPYLTAMSPNAAPAVAFQPFTLPAWNRFKQHASCQCCRRVWLEEQEHWSQQSNGNANQAANIPPCTCSCDDPDFVCDCTAADGMLRVSPSGRFSAHPLHHFFTLDLTLHSRSLGVTISSPQQLHFYTEKMAQLWVWMLQNKVGDSVEEEMAAGNTMPFTVQVAMGYSALPDPALRCLGFQLLALLLSERGVCEVEQSVYLDFMLWTLEQRAHRGAALFARRQEDSSLSLAHVQQELKEAQTAEDERLQSLLQELCAHLPVAGMQAHAASLVQAASGCMRFTSHLPLLHSLVGLSIGLLDRHPQLTLHLLPDLYSCVLQQLQRAHEENRCLLVLPKRMSTFLSEVAERHLFPFVSLSSVWEKRVFSRAASAPLQAALTLHQQQQDQFNDMPLLERHGGAAASMQQSQGSGGGGRGGKSRGHALAADASSVGTPSKRKKTTHASPNSGGTAATGHVAAASSVVDAAMLLSSIPALATVSPQESILTALQPFVHQLLHQSLPKDGAPASASASASAADVPHPSQVPPAHALVMLLQLDQVVRIICPHLESRSSPAASPTASKPSLQLNQSVVSQLNSWVLWLNELCRSRLAAAGSTSIPAAHVDAFPLLPSMLQCMLSLLRSCAIQPGLSILHSLRSAMMQLCVWTLRLAAEKKPAGADASPCSLSLSVAISALHLVCTLPVDDLAGEMQLITDALESEHVALQCAAVMLLPSFVARMAEADKRAQSKQLLQLLSRRLTATSTAQSGAAAADPAAASSSATQIRDQHIHLRDAVASSIGPLVCALHASSSANDAVSPRVLRAKHNPFLTDQLVFIAGRTSAQSDFLDVAVETSVEQALEVSARGVNLSQRSRSDDEANSQMSSSQSDANAAANDPSGSGLITRPLRQLLEPILSRSYCACCDGVQSFAGQGATVHVPLKQLLPFFALLDASQPTAVRLSMLRGCARLLRHLHPSEWSFRPPRGGSTSLTVPMSPPPKSRVISSPPASRSKGSAHESFSLSQVAGGSGKKLNPRMSRLPQSSQQQQQASLSLDPSSPPGSGSQMMDVDDGDGARSTPLSDDAVVLHPLALQLLFLLFDPAESVRRCFVEQLQGWMDADGKAGPFLSLFNKAGGAASPAAGAAAATAASASGAAFNSTPFDLFHSCIAMVQSHWQLLPLWQERTMRALQSMANSSSSSTGAEGVALAVVFEPDAAMEPLCFTPAYLLTTYAAIGELALFTPLGSASQQLFLWQLVDVTSHATSFLQADSQEPPDLRILWMHLQSLMLHHVTRIAHCHGLTTSALFFLHSSSLFKQIFNPHAPTHPKLLQLLFEHFIINDGVTPPAASAVLSTSLLAAPVSRHNSALQLREFYKEGVRMLLPSMLLDEFSVFCESNGAGADTIHQLASWCVDDGSTRSLILTMLDHILPHLLRFPAHYTQSFVQGKLLPYLGHTLQAQSGHFKQFVGMVHANVTFDLLWRMGDATQQSQALQAVAWVMDVMKETPKPQASSGSIVVAKPAQSKNGASLPSSPSSMQPFSLSAPMPSSSALAEFFQPLFLGAFTKLHGLLTATFPPADRSSQPTRVPQVYKIHALHALAMLMQLTKDRLKGFIPKVLASMQLLTSAAFKDPSLATMAAGVRVPPLPFHLLCVWSIFIDTLISSNNIGEYLSTIVVTLVHVLAKLTDQQQKVNAAPSAGGASAMQVDDGKGAAAAAAAASSSASNSNSSSNVNASMLFSMADFNSYRSSLPTPRVPKSGHAPELFFVWISSLPEHLLEQALAPEAQIAELSRTPSQAAAAAKVASLTPASLRSHCMAHILSILNDLLLTGKVKDLNNLLKSIPMLPPLPSLQPVHDLMQRNFDAELERRVQLVPQDSSTIDVRPTPQSTPASSGSSRSSRDKQDSQVKQAERHAEICSFFLRIERLLSTMSHEAPQVRTFSLKHFRALLSDPSNRGAWDAYCNMDMGGAFGVSTAQAPMHARLTNLLASLLQRCSDSKQENRLLASECLGEIGAIDPSHLGGAISVKPPQYAFQHGTHYRTVHLAHFLIQNLLVRALRSAVDTLAQDRALCAIQQLLKYCGIGLDLQYIAEANQALLSTHKMPQPQSSRTSHLDEQVRALVKQRPPADFLPHSALTSGQQLNQAYQAMALWLDFPSDVRAVIAPCLSSSYLIADVFLRPVAPPPPVLAFKVDERSAEDSTGRKGGASGRKRKEISTDADGDDGAAGPKPKAAKTTPERKKGGSAVVSAAAASSKDDAPNPLPSLPVLTSSTIIPLPSKPVFRSKQTMAQWVSSFTRYLIAYSALPISNVSESAPPAPASSLPSAAIPETLLYQACIGVVQSDTGTALFLLPYLVDHALRYGNDALRDFIRREIMAVLNTHNRPDAAAQHANASQVDGAMSQTALHASLSSTSSSSSSSSSSHSSAQLCIQAVFELLDTLNEWLVKERRSNELAKMSPSSGSGSASSAMSGTIADSMRPGQLPLSFGPSNSNAAAASVVPSAPLPPARTLDSYKSFLDSIPKKTLALAAYHCKAFTRALKYMELYLREEKEKYRITIEKREAMMHQPKRGRATHTSAAAAAASLSADQSGSSDQLITTGVGAGLLTSDLDSCQNMYAALEEPDGMRGLASLRQKASVQSEIKDLESLGKWGEALTSYEKCLQIYPAQTHLHTGMLECYRNLGQWRAGLSYSQGLLSDLSLPQDDQRQVAMFGVQYAWRLRDWNTVQQLLSDNQHAPDNAQFEVRLAALLLALHKGDKEQYEIELRRARLCVLSPLSAASWESYERAYPFLLQLQMVQEVEQMRTAMLKVDEAAPGKRGALEHNVANLLAGSPPTLLAAHSNTAASSFSSHSLSPTFTSPTGALRESLSQLGMVWSARLRRTTQTFRIREHVLSLRRVLYSEFQLGADAGMGWLQLAQQAREASQLEIAQGALLHASEMGVNNTFLERAKLMRAKGGQWMHDALVFLERETAALKASNGASGAGSQSVLDIANKDAMTKCLLATTYLLLGQWIQESSAKESKEVIRLYTEAIFVQPKWETAHFCLGKYYDELLAAETSRSRALAARQGGASSLADDRARGSGSSKSKGSVHGAVTPDTLSKFLYAILKSYGMTLSLGHKYLFQAMPRMLTLWFEHSEHWSGDIVTHPQTGSGGGANAGRGGAASSTQQSTSSHSTVATRVVPQTLEEKFSQCHMCMMELIKTLAPFQWLTAFPQIISRLTHSNKCVYEFLKDIIVKVFAEYPQQAMWMLAVVTRSIDPERHRRSKEILAAVRKTAPSTCVILDKALALFEQLFRLCGMMPKQRKPESLLMSRDVPLLFAMTGLPVIVPIQQQLTVTLPPQGADFIAGSGDACVEAAASGSFTYDHNYRNVVRTYRAFPASQVNIQSFQNEIEVLKSKERPKKLTVMGSDGRAYSFLCKKEIKGDMRKNSRMMECNTVVNRLLREHPDSRSRQLALRTFSVLPMSEECGLIEWVPNTTGFRHLVRATHDEEGILTCFTTIKRLYEEHNAIVPSDIANEIRLYHRLCDLYRPVFHKWFLNQFPEPSAWFQARLKFARSSAVWSMVGYVVGLGDRHGENILIDESSGDCVHVDFDCLCEDHELLTEDGFIGLDALLELEAKDALPRFATYDPTNQQLCYQSIAGRILVKPGSADGRPVVDFESLDQSHVWSSNDEGGVSAGNTPSPGGHIALSVTAKHQMFVQTGRASSADQANSPVQWAQEDGAAESFEKQDAATLVTGDARLKVKLLAFASEGVDRSASAIAYLPFMARLQLSTSTHCSAFLELYGFWLGAGSMAESSDTNCDALHFHLRGQRDEEYLQGLLDSLQLRSGEDYSLLETDTSAPVDGSSNSARVMALHCPRWFDLFNEEYGSCSESEETGVKTSGRGLWGWVLQRLSRDEIRLLIRGLQRADRSSSEDGNVHGIRVSSVRIRDQLVHACLQAGYTAYFEECAHERAERGDAVPVRAWTVRYSDAPVDVTPVLHASRDIRERREMGRVWCVNVPPHHLIWARRARTSADGVVIAASRPTVVGNCLFNKGMTLEKPERVPFRLTPNMVDALGVTGVEGLFASSAECAMHVMRSNQQTMMSVLHTFIYDPLVEWKAATPNAHGGSTSSVVSSVATGVPPSGGFNPNAVRILDDIEMKLRGQVAKESLPLSVHGQVAQLIKEATSQANLAQMYIGWMAWL